MEKPLKSATNSGIFFVGSAKREYNSDVTKKNKHLEETYSVLLLNKEANRLVKITWCLVYVGHSGLNTELLPLGMVLQMCPGT